ncbi:hypothetical protein LSUE1_G002731 [Lachnellula suecica]|uniref:Uncharacterized protein n=1 Tax=Lachnellula suecica TaxID=602035 RepID=A0A8T9CFF4_9HELO|nr:hypothetical protein LSUE1_G002731 [Lachnellula suecica]
MKNEKAAATDVILSIRDPFMQQMIDGEKIYEFRPYRMQSPVVRIWFYRVAPLSRVEYVCEIEPAVVREDVDPKFSGNGTETKETNKGKIKPEFAYKILSVYKLNAPITLVALKKDHGVGGAPQGMVYTPSSILESVEWKCQTRLR